MHGASQTHFQKQVDILIRLLKYKIAYIKRLLSRLI